MTGKRILTLCVPVLNEESNISELLDRLRGVAEKLPQYETEFLFVDDGSTDGTFSLLAAHSAHDQSVKVIKLSRNFGHQAALSAGLNYARGDYFISLDADLQDPPELVLEMIERAERGDEIVYTVRRSREASVGMRTLYSTFYRSLAMLSDVDIPMQSGDFALLSRRVVDTLNALPERHLFLRGLRAWTGFRSSAIVHDRPARHSGDSKYSFAKLLRLALDGLFSFSTKPLSCMFVLGLIASSLGVLFTTYAIYERLFLDSSPSGFTALLSVIVFFSGVQLIGLGILGEYLGRVFEQTKMRPRYLVDRAVNIEGAAKIESGGAWEASQTISSKEP